MRSLFVAIVAAAGLCAAGAANAQEALAKSSGCLNCHDVSAKKIGPSFKEISAKYKGKADAAATIETKLSSAKGHPEVKAKGDDLKSLVKWVLSQ